jgi:hypothetical protein
MQTSFQFLNGWHRGGGDTVVGHSCSHQDAERDMDAHLSWRVSFLSEDDRGPVRPPLSKSPVLTLVRST